MAADGLSGGAAGLAGAVRVDGDHPAELVQQHIVVPDAEAFEVDQAGRAAVGAVHHMVRLTGGGGPARPGSPSLRGPDQPDPSTKVAAGPPACRVSPLLAA
jgi:hypothetical protein